MIINNNSNWHKTETHIFWGEIAPCDHVVQIYENDSIFLDALAGFVGGGINSGECAIVIATEQHLQALNQRLESFGVKVKTLLQDERYIPLNAEKTLGKFMVNGWPDEALFNKTISELFLKAQSKNRKIRAFGEMVAILWAEGLTGATVNLEHLWNKLCAKQSLSLFCAYPKSGFTKDILQSINEICNCHSKLLNGSKQSLTEVLYQDVN